jgi:hypothetical protein
MAQQEFIPYEQALELKQLGFDEPCLAFYNGKFLDSTDYDFDNGTSKDIGLCIVAPLYKQAFRWFRERYSILLYKDYGKVPHFTIIQNLMFENPIITYEEAELACLKKLIEIVKNK